jgi:hypothetical protein
LLTGLGVENSFDGLSAQNLARKLLNPRSTRSRKFAEITALVPFSAATGFFSNYLPESPNVKLWLTGDHGARFRLIVGDPSAKFLRKGRIILAGRKGKGPASGLCCVGKAADF